MYALQKVPVWGDCENDVTEEIEGVTDLKVEVSYFADGSPTIMFQLEDHQLTAAMLHTIMNIEICYKTYLYTLHDIKAIVAPHGSHSFGGGVRFLLIFQQQTYMN